VLRLYDNEPATYSPDLTFIAFVQYLIDGWILPKLDVSFNMGTGGRAWNDGELRADWDGINKNGFTKDAMNMALSPSCQFRFGSANQVLTVGYTMQMNLSDGATAGPGVATSRNGLFASYQVSF
jgi:hypothetical protein